MELVNKEIIYFFEEMKETLDNSLKISSDVLRKVSQFDISENKVSEYSIILGDFKNIKLNYLMLIIKIIQFRKKHYFTETETFITLLEEFKQQQVLMLNSFLSYSYDVKNINYESGSLRIEIIKIINQLDYCINSLKTFKEFDYI